MLPPQIQFISRKAQVIPEGLDSWGDSVATLERRILIMAMLLAERRSQKSNYLITRQSSLANTKCIKHVFVILR